LRTASNVRTGCSGRLVFCIALALVLAAARAVAQHDPASQTEELPALSVETIGIEPTVAMTGDVLTAAYRVRFKNLTAQGKEIIVLEDRMAPDKLPFAPFDGLGLEVDKRQVGDEHVWDFVYRLRIVRPVKEVQVVRSLTFYWLIRDFGQKIEEARVLQAETAPLQVRYVSTITDEPVLDVRDEIDLGSFRRRALVSRGIAWIVAPLPLAFWIVAAVRSARRPRQIPAGRQLDDIDASDTPLAAAPSSRQTQQNLLRHLRELAALAGPPGAPASADLHRRLVVSLREYLLAHIPALNPGDTAKEIRRHVETLRDGKRAELLAVLSGRLVAYQDALERNEPAPIGDPAAEARAIQAVVNALRWRGRFNERLAAMVRRS
jgi:hypothetical protein